MVIVVMGVSGSGKSTVGKKLAESLGWKYFDADDFHSKANVQKMKSGVPLTDADREPWLHELRDLIKDCLEKKTDAVLACSALKEIYRKHLLVNDDVRLVYLKGDQDMIEDRLNRRRGHFMNPALLESQFATLEEPVEGTRVDAAGDPDEIVKTIRKRLDLDSNGPDQQQS
jgi:gluconokinase